MSRAVQRRVLVVSQVYPPDPAAVGQHLADACAELVRRGWGVVVFTADRGYDDPTRVFPRREARDGVEIRRLPASSFGKQSVVWRGLAWVSFLAQAVLRGLWQRGVERVLVSTSPPIAGLAGVALAAWHRAPLTYWVMDLNPDQMVALGIAAPTSRLVRLFDAANRFILRRADSVVVLDRFMARRVEAKAPLDGRMHVIPPWSLEEPPAPLPHADNPFRQQHGWGDRFVVMYSGNHSPSHPLTTLLRAAEALQDDPRFVFAFIGGGLAKREVEACPARNIVSLPYQPIETLRSSLSAADLHVVTMGDDMVGVVHPCKVYGALAVGRPILFLGPSPCHVTDLVAADPVMWHVRHGDVEGCVRAIREAAGEGPQAWQARGERALGVVRERYRAEELRGAFCDVVEGRSREAP